MFKHISTRTNAIPIIVIFRHHLKNAWTISTIGCNPTGVHPIDRISGQATRYAPFALVFTPGPDPEPNWEIISLRSAKERFNVFNSPEYMPAPAYVVLREDVLGKQTKEQLFASYTDLTKNRTFNPAYDPDTIMTKFWSGEWEHDPDYITRNLSIALSDLQTEKQRFKWFSLIAALGEYNQIEPSDKASIFRKAAIQSPAFCHFAYEMKHYRGPGEIDISEAGRLAFSIFLADPAFRGIADYPGVPLMIYDLLSQSTANTHAFNPILDAAFAICTHLDQHGSGPFRGVIDLPTFLERTLEKWTFRAPGNDTDEKRQILLELAKKQGKNPELGGEDVRISMQFESETNTELAKETVTGPAFKTLLMNLTDAAPTEWHIFSAFLRAPENWPSKLELSSEEMCRIVDLIGRMDAPISSEKVDPKGLLIHVLGRYARTSHRDKIPNLESVLLSLWQDPTIHKIPSIPLFLGCALLHFLPVAHPQFPEILNTVAKDRSDCPSPDVLEKVLRIVICLPPNTLPVGRLPKDPSVLQYAIYRNNSQNPAPAKSIMLKLQKEITPALPLLYLAMIQDSQTTNIAISKIQFDQVITFSKSTKPELKTKSTTLLTNNFGTWAKFHPPIEWINHFNSLCREDLADVFSQVDHSVIISAIVKLDPESATATLLRIFSNPEIPKDAQNSFAELFVRHDRAKIKPLVVKLIQSIRDTAAIPACVIELGLTHLWEAGRFESVLSELNAIKTDHPAIVASFMPKIGRYFLNGIQSGKDDTRWVRPLFENHSGSITAYSPIDQEILALTFVLSNLPLPVAFQFGSISPALTELIKTIASSRHPASEKCLVILAEIASRNPAKRDQFSDIATKVAKSGDPESIARLTRALLSFPITEPIRDQVSTIFSGIHPANRPRAISIALLDANVLSENREFLFRIPRFTESNTNQLLQVFNTVLNRTGQLPFPAWRIVERALIDPSVPDDVFRNAMELTANHVESVSSATWNQVNLALFSPDSTDQGIRRFAMVREFPEIFRRLVPVSSFGRHTADLD